MNRQRRIPRLLLLAGIAGAVLWAGTHRDQLDPAALDAWLSGLGIWAPVVYVTLFAAGTVVFLPGSLFATSQRRPIQSRILTWSFSRRRPP